MFANTLVSSVLNKKDPRILLVDAAAGYVHPALAYTRNTSISVPQQDGSLSTFALDQIPRTYEPSIGWNYRFEASFTQICLRTHGLTNAAWTRTGLLGSSQDTVSPTGATDSWSFLESTANSAHGISQSISFTSGSTYLIQAVAAVRAGTRYLTLVLPSAAFTSDAIATFDLSNGSAVKNATAVAAGSRQLSASHYLVYMFATATATASGNIQMNLHRSATATVDSYTGDGTSGLSIWGINVSASSYVVPFVNSFGTTSTVGNSTLQGLVQNVSAQIGQEYSLGCEFFVNSYVAGSPGTRVALQADNNGTTERGVIRLSAANALRGVVVVGNTSVYSGQATGNDGLLHKIWLRVSSNYGQARAAFNGTLVAGGSVASPAQPTWLRVGIDSASTNYLNGGVLRAWIVKEPLSDDKLALYST